ncbi:MAG: copper resistance protein CopC [Actinobacteria bacterium]|nr:copper resistance protein CopC [Actinomycetota bacterium]
MIKKILALTIATLFTSSIAAFAHGEVVQAFPAADSNVLTAPKEVSIEFDGKLQTIGNAVVNLITVTDNQGQVVSSPTSVVEANKISTRLQLTDITGLVSVHYRIVSEDGHPVEGDYSFTVGENPTLTSAQDEEAAEAEAGISEESGSNLLVNGVGILLIIGIVFAVVRRIKK